MLEVGVVAAILRVTARKRLITPYINIYIYIYIEREREIERDRER